MTDESQALAHELMTITRTADKAIGMMRKMFDGETGPLLDDVLDVEALRQHMHNAGTLAAAEVFTESEMRDSLAFYNSPSGRTIDAKQPEFERRIEASMQAYMTTVLKL